MQDLKELLQKCPEKGQTFPKVGPNRYFAGTGSILHFLMAMSENESEGQKIRQRQEGHQRSMNPEEP